MIVGIGIDMIEIERAKKACQKKAFLTRCFSVREQELIKNNYEKAAGNWAVKESVGKCLGVGITGFELYEVEVLRNEKGKPYIELSGKALKLSQEMGIDHIHVSISNTKVYAIAYVICEKAEEH